MWSVFNSAVSVPLSLCCLKGLSVFLADLPTSHTQEKKTKTMLPGVVFFNPKNSIFCVFYKKFDWIILKIWSLLLFSKGVRETNGGLKERSVNRRGRRRVPLDDTMASILKSIFDVQIWIPNNLVCTRGLYLKLCLHSSKPVISKIWWSGLQNSKI